MNGPEGVTSPASLEAAARESGASTGRQQRLTEQVTQDLRVHMSFTQPAQARPKVSYIPLQCISRYRVQLRAGASKVSVPCVGLKG